jgi:hypothetical protein
MHKNKRAYCKVLIANYEKLLEMEVGSYDFNWVSNKLFVQDRLRYKAWTEWNPQQKFGKGLKLHKNMIVYNFTFAAIWSANNVT